MSEIKIEAFIKAVDSQFYDNFIDKGQICLNTVKWFRDFENEDQNVGDSFEGVAMACYNTTAFLVLRQFWCNLKHL